MKNIMNCLLCLLRHLSLLIIVTTIVILRDELTCEAKFEPYTLNGGLVSAVAGPDYVIIAADTRLSEGYEILSRNHLSSRLWSVVPHGHIADVENNIDSQSSSIIQADGSVKIPSLDEKPSKQILKFHSPTFIASAGCASDCEALKRQMRLEVNAHIHWNYGLDTTSPNGLANVLGQTLYSRRGFPFYSFCILAGISADETNCEGGRGIVHTYDAIGSHEKVAVATAGTGREMLQPILDRLFSTISTENEIISSGNTTETIQRDRRAVVASKQRVGLKLKPPVETFVSCDCDEAVSLLVKGYKSVAEREIAVGDNVVVCVIKPYKGTIDTDDFIENPLGQFCSLEVLRFKLKHH